MAVIFASEPGIAVAIVDPNVLPITFGFGGWGNFNNRNSIIQRIGISSASNHQFLYTLRNFTYVYIFGEKAGDFIISGLSFMGDCGGLNFEGISQVINYYATFGLSQYGNVVPIQIGLAGFYGFLIGITVGIENPETRLGRFSYTFKTLPAR
jgi:hypothetical protein